MDTGRYKRTDDVCSDQMLEKEISSRIEGLDFSGKCYTNRMVQKLDDVCLVA